METRTITQVHIYYLVLNTFGAAEDGAIVAISDERQKLVDYYNSQLLVEGVRDSAGYYHSFEEGSLYNYNPCDIDRIGLYGHGIHDEWVDENVYYNHIKDRYLNI